MMFPFGMRISEGKPWSDIDDSDLLDFDEQRKSIEKTADFLQRTEDEVGDSDRGAAAEGTDKKARPGRPCRPLILAIAGRAPRG